ncbi:MAG: FkbM family methyltransferase [Planctomycetia bacterium]
MGAPARPLPCHDRGLAAREIAQLLAGVAQPTLVEVGANDGSDTRAFARELPHARLHAFECDPRALQRFRQKGVPATATLHAHAVGREEGEATFHASAGHAPPKRRSLGGRLRHALRRLLGRGSDGRGHGAFEAPREWDLSGSLRTPQGHLEAYPWITFDASFTVKVRPLDAWWAEQGRPPIDLLWMDVQGAEGDVLSGARAALAATHYVYAEFDPDPARPLYAGSLGLEATLEALGPGWQGVGLYAGNNVLARNGRRTPPA